MNNTQKSSTFSFNQMVVVAITGLLFFSAYTYYESNNNERLFTAHFEPAENSFVNLRGDSPLAAELNEAMAFYENKNYEAALPHFESYLATQKDDFKAMLYAGISHLETVQLNKSIDFLETTRINAPKYFEEASWYLALAHIRNEQLAEAKRILAETANNGETQYGKRAEKLLAEIMIEK